MTIVPEIGQKVYENPALELLQEYPEPQVFLCRCAIAAKMKNETRS